MGGKVTLNIDFPLQQRLDRSRASSREGTPALWSSDHRPWRPGSAMGSAPPSSRHACAGPRWLRYTRWRTARPRTPSASGEDGMEAVWANTTPTGRRAGWGLTTRLRGTGEVAPVDRQHAPFHLHASYDASSWDVMMVNGYGDAPILPASRPGTPSLTPQLVDEGHVVCTGSPIPHGIMPGPSGVSQDGRMC